MRGKVVETAFGDVDESEYWTKLEDQINGLVDGWWVTGEQLQNALNNLGTTAQESVSNASGTLDAAWREMTEHLRAFAQGPEYMQMPDYFQQQMDDYFAGMIEGIDQSAEVTTDKLSQMAMRLKQRQAQLFEIASDPKLGDLFAQYDDMLGAAGSQDLDALNGLVEQINTILDAKNKLLSKEDQLPKLQVFDPQSLDEAQQQLYDATVLAEGLQKAYDKIAQANEAKAAEDSFYSQQVAQLKDAFGAGDAAGLAKYIDRLNELYAANSDVAEGMLKMFPVLGQIANGELEAADAVEALNLMQLEAARTARERTADMVEQAEAEQRLAQQQKQHYAGMLDELKKVFDAQGAAAFSTAFDELPEQAKGDIAKLYPEVARLAAGL